VTKAGQSLAAATTSSPRALITAARQSLAFADRVPSLTASIAWLIAKALSAGVGSSTLGALTPKVTSVALATARAAPAPVTHLRVPATRTLAVTRPAPSLARELLLLTRPFLTVARASLSLTRALLKPTSCLHAVARCIRKLEDPIAITTIPSVGVSERAQVVRSLLVKARVGFVRVRKRLVKGSKRAFTPRRCLVFFGSLLVSLKDWLVNLSIAVVNESGVTPAVTAPPRALTPGPSAARAGSSRGSAARAPRPGSYTPLAARRAPWSRGPPGAAAGRARRSVG
jgi:hypothetical protein